MTTLEVRVSAGAKNNRILGYLGSTLKVSLQAPREKGKANKALCGYLAKSLGLPVSGVCLLKGERSPDKVVSVNLAPEELSRKLETLLNQA